MAQISTAVKKPLCPLNFGSGEKIRIGELVYMIKELAGYDGEVE